MLQMQAGDNFQLTMNLRPAPNFGGAGMRLVPGGGSPGLQDHWSVEEGREPVETLLPGGPAASQASPSVGQLRVFEVVLVCFSVGGFIWELGRPLDFSSRWTFGQFFQWFLTERRDTPPTP